MVVVSPSTVTLDHLYAKNDDLFEEDVFSDASFLNTWNQGSGSDEDDLLNLLFGEEFTAFDNVSLPRSESTSSDSCMTPSPGGTDDVELCEVISSSSSSPGLPQGSDDFNIDFGWTADFDLPDLEGRTDDQELMTITSSLPTSAASSTITVSEPAESVCPPTSYSQRNKSSVLTLTSEEKRLLENEGVVLPTDMPLTKAEEKVLKKVRRKIKNKQSAQESRRKKKDYVVGLEKRVKRCTEDNLNLNKKVQSLEEKNKSLLDQLKDLQTLVASTHPSKAQAGTCLMVLFLAFGLVLFPINGPNSAEKKSSEATYATTIVRSRTLLQMQEEYVPETDEVPDTVRYNLNNSDYLKAVPLTSQTKTSLGDVTVAVSEIEIERRSQENKIEAQKR